MRRPRWLRGPWLTTEGSPSDEQIDLWNEKHWDTFWPRRTFQRKLDGELEWLDAFLKAEKHMEYDGTFLLTMADYTHITGEKRIARWCW